MDRLDRLRAARDWRKAELATITFTENDLCMVPVEELARQWSKKLVLEHVIAELDARIVAAASDVDAMWSSTREAMQRERAKNWGATQ